MLTCICCLIEYIPESAVEKTLTKGGIGVPFWGLKFFIFLFFRCFPNLSVNNFAKIYFLEVCNQTIINILKSPCVGFSQKCHGIFGGDGGVQFLQIYSSVSKDYDIEFGEENSDHGYDGHDDGVYPMETDDCIYTPRREESSKYID